MAVPFWLKPKWCFSLGGDSIIGGLPPWFVFNSSMTLARHGLAGRLVGLCHLVGVLYAFSGAFGGLGGFHGSGWRPWRGCSPLSRPATTGSGHLCRNSAPTRRITPESDTSGASGLGIPTREEKGACGQWAGPSILGGPGSMGHHSSCTSGWDTTVPYCHHARKENEVFPDLRSVRRDRIRGGGRTAETAVATDLHQQDRWTSTRSRRTKHRANKCHKEKAECRTGPVRGLRTVLAIWQESAKSAKVQNLPSNTGRWVHDERSSWPELLQSMAGVIQSLQISAANVGSGIHGNSSGLRKPHREDVQALQQCMAFDCRGRRPCPGGAPQHGDRQRREAAALLGQRQPVGSSLQASHQGLKFLAGAGTPPSKCMASSRGERCATHTSRSLCCQFNAGRIGSHQSRHGSSEDLITEDFRAKDEKPNPEGGKTKTHPSGQRGITEAERCFEQRQWQRKGQRQRSTTALFRLEQQQWGLCWPPSRIRLPRKGNPRAQMHRLRKSRTPSASVPKEVMTAVRWLFGVTWGKEEERKEARLPKQEAGNTPQQEGRRRKRKRDPTERKRDDDKGDEVDFGDKKMTEAQYLRKRRFRFLHYYAGPEDPLGKALRAEAEKHNMKITVVSCEKEGPDGVDLLEEEPFNGQG